MQNPVSDSVLPLRFSARIAFAVFVVALGLHFYFATVSWTHGFMLGHEFRQAQTALIAEYIDKQNNFGIYYETPILGKPWAFPLEFPFYQWCVVGVKRGLGLPDYEAARAVSLGSFYLTLPAIYILLGSLNIPVVRRWIMLALVMFCPVYIFYARAFLIDPMATMASAWFLTAFVHMMQTRTWYWFLIATVAGTLGALIKSLVFFVWLFPAAVFGAWSLWQVGRSCRTIKPMVVTAMWGIGSVVLPYVSLHWWVGYTDAIKAVHRSAYIFTSKALTEGNFGMFSVESRLSLATWQELWKRWSEAITYPGVVAVVLLVGLVFCRRERRYILGFFGVWIFGQLVFPYAYAYQDYYFYAGAVFLVLAFGFVVTGLLALTSWPIWLRLPLALVPFCALGTSYLTGYYPGQRLQSPGGSGMTAAIRDILPAKSIIAIIGEDWSAVVPYYAKHRAWMVRSGLELDPEYLVGAIEDLADEDIGLLLVSDRSRTNTKMIEMVTKQLGLQSQPMFSHNITDVYVSPLYVGVFETRLGPNGSAYPGITMRESPSQMAENSLIPFKVSPGMSKSAFSNIKPGVSRVQLMFGYNRADDGSPLGFHANSDLWMAECPSTGRVAWEFGISDGAWDREGDKTNGVDFLVFAESPTGERRELFRRSLDPAERLEDRGKQHAEFDYQLGSEETLVFVSRDAGSAAFDWAYLSSIDVR